MGDLGLAQPMRREIRSDFGAERREIARRRRQAAPQIAGDALAMDRLEAERLRIEAFAHVASEQQPAIEVIAPIVIRADQSDRRAALRRTDSGNAMPTGIVAGWDHGR